MTRELYKEQLRKLNGELVSMGDMCEEAMSLVMKALREKDEKIADGVHKLEQDIDEKERDIESMCMQLLLRQQPVAGDLRNISSALRMIADMERIGDQTADIADITKILTEFQLEVHPTVFTMGKLVSKMVDDSISAFVRKDEKLAKQVIESDDEIDDLFMQVKSELVQEIIKNKNVDGYELDVFMIAKYMERIGDHAVNLGEWVIYSMEGKKEV
jgi:phosphate transport system protein